MEYKTSRMTEDKQEAKILIVYIGDDRYTLKETVDGRLLINKVSDSGDNDYMSVHPRSGNEIEIS